MYPRPGWSSSMGRGAWCRLRICFCGAGSRNGQFASRREWVLYHAMLSPTVRQEQEMSPLSKCRRQHDAGRSPSLRRRCESEPFLPRVRFLEDSDAALSHAAKTTSSDGSLDPGRRPTKPAFLCSFSTTSTWCWFFLPHQPCNPSMPRLSGTWSFLVTAFCTGLVSLPKTMFLRT
jgi:hypothetical protein